MMVIVMVVLVMVVQVMVLIATLFERPLDFNISTYFADIGNYFLRFQYRKCTPITKNGLIPV